MKVWIDVLTPKQVLFFGPLIEELEENGTRVLATSRKYREVGPLAERAGLRLKFIGERGGRGLEEQLLAATRRQAEMIPVVENFSPDVALSVASGVCARVAFGLGIKHVAVNDSPHSEVAGRLSIPLSYHLLCPWIIPYREWMKFGLDRRQVTTYHALDPVVWLRRKPIPGPTPLLDASKKTITVRVQESDSPYLAKADTGWTDALLRALIEGFPGANIVALCRYGYQVEEVKAKFGTRCIVPDEVVSGRDMLAATDVFVGMGGTMNAEAALMGVPTISAFQGSLMTDAYLESRDLLAKARTSTRVVSYAMAFLRESFRADFKKRAKRLMDSMEDPIPKIVKRLEAAAGLS